MVVELGVPPVLAVGSVNNSDLQLRIVAMGIIKNVEDIITAEEGSDNA